MQTRRRNWQVLLAMVLVALIVVAGAVLAGGQEIAPVRDGGKYLGRQFNPDFDLLFDDFTRPILADVGGTGLWWAKTEGDGAHLTEREGYLRARYSPQLGTTKDAPIYKVASPANTQGAYEFLVLVMRGKEGAKLQDLVLSFRYDDNYADIDLDFLDLFDPDFDYLPELTGEYQLYIIDLNNSLDEAEFNRLPGKQGPERIPAGREIAGFHLLAKESGQGSGVVELREVYWSKDAVTLGFAATPDNFLLDDFKREDVGEANPDIWWRGAGPGSQIIGDWLALDYSQGAAMYMAAGYETSNAQGHYENVVFRAQGVAGDFLVAPFYVVEGEEILGTAIPLSELKGPDGEVVPRLAAVMQNLVINFAENGWEQHVNGFRLESGPDSAGLVYIDQIFFTNLAYDASEVAAGYPVLDGANILVFDDFKREVLGATADYDPNNPVALENDLRFIIAYAGIDRLSIEEGALVFDCSQNPEYIQYTTGSNLINDGSYRYLVLKVKGEDGASLEHFRMATLGENDARSKIVWANGGLKSGKGLSTPQLDDQDYPYRSEDGWLYLIVDLQASGLGEVVSGFDLFYGEMGKLFIDAIFFANPGSPPIAEDSKLVFAEFARSELIPSGDLFAELGKWYMEGENAAVQDEALVLAARDGLHAYFKTAGYPSNFDESQPYLVLTMKGAAGTELESFRLFAINDQGESEVRFANAGHLVSAPGQALPALREEYQTFVIDLAASGLPLNVQGLCLSFGSWDSGELFIKEIAFASGENVAAVLDAALAR